MVEVEVDKASDLDRAMEDAVQKVTDAATQERIRVTITRVGDGQYVV